MMEDHPLSRVSHCDLKQNQESQFTLISALQRNTTPRLDLFRLLRGFISLLLPIKSEPTGSILMKTTWVGGLQAVH
jgi:hypothetical protein